MDPKEDSVLNLLFDNKDLDELQGNTNFQDYVNKICTLTTSDLTKEIHKLKDENTSIVEQMQELSITNYKTLIQTAECSHNMLKGFNEIEGKLDKLMVNIPEFETKCSSFANNTSGINHLRRLNTLTLTRSAQLLEILELPQLMDSFITDNLYEDALELTAYVRRLHSKHPDIPLFEAIMIEVNASWLTMLHNLLTQLRQDLQLAQCLQIVSYLRRMEVFTETELRLKFLQAREVCLQRSLNAINETNVNRRLNKIIEITRVNLFSVITQYKAIFSDDDEHSLSSTSSTLNQNIIFFSWIRDKIFEFLSTLEIHLMKDVTSIDSILGQCMYFGLSFSRVGCDFRSLMIPIFTKAVAQKFESAVSAATKTFEKNMERFTLINKNHPSVPWKNKSNNPIQPPESLLEFYPLAEYLNNILVALNELRLCAPISVISSIINSIQESLITISKTILVLYGQEQQAFTSNSKEAFVRLCLCFADDLIPYLQKCIHIIFSPTSISEHLSYNIQNLHKDGITSLNKNIVIDPIKHLLPVKYEPILSVENEVTDNEAESHIVEEKHVQDKAE